MHVCLPFPLQRDRTDHQYLLCSGRPSAAFVLPLFCHKGTLSSRYSVVYMHIMFIQITLRQSLISAQHSPVSVLVL